MNKRHYPLKSLPVRAGFTLLEILIVISIIGILTAFIFSNFTGARERARDVKKKQELHELQIALNLYQNTYQQYPATGNGNDFNACGQDGLLPCPCSPSLYFAIGASCETVLIPKVTLSEGSPFFRYYPCQNGESYRLLATLENLSDPELSESQARCPAAACGLSYTSNDYVACP